MAKVVKPLDFTVLKGHTVDKERAIQSQMRFNNEYIVRKGNNYYSNGPPVQCCGDRKTLIS